MLTPQDQNDVLTSVLALAGDAETLIRHCSTLARALGDPQAGLPEAERVTTATRLMDHTLALSDHIVRSTERLTHLPWREDRAVLGHCRQMAGEMDAILAEVQITIAEAVRLLQTAARQRAVAQQSCDALLRKLRHGA